MLSIDLAIADFTKAAVDKINYGYSECHIKLSQDQVHKLLSYKSTIRRFYDKMRQKVMNCLCNSELQRVKEQVARIIDINRCKAEKVSDIRYDYSGYDQWVASNINCVAYDVWERNLLKCNPTFSITVTKKEQPVRTLYAIVKKDKDNCVLKFLAYAHRAKCERKVAASAKSKEKCAIELKALVAEHKCNLSLSLYTRLLKCNLSFNLISKVLGCGGKFIVDDDGNPKVKIGAKVSKVEDLAELASGVWNDMDISEYQGAYD